MGTPRRTDQGREFAATFGKFIRIARRKRGLTNESLALLIGVRQQAVSNWECGHMLPSWEIMFKLSAALKMPMWMIVRTVEQHIEKEKESKND